MTYSPPFHGTIFKKNQPNKQTALGLFTCRTDNFSHSPDWQCHTMPWKVLRTCLYVPLGTLSLGMVWWTESQGRPQKNLMGLEEVVTMKRVWRILLSS